MKVLILCTGNSCRSQMAHGFLQSFDDSLEVYSGGTEPAAQVNPKAVEVMKEVGIDISNHIPTHAAFTGKVGKRLHIGFDDPSHATGTEEFINSEFRRVRDEIKNGFARFYITEIKKQELPKCSCGGKC